MVSGHEGELCPHQTSLRSLRTLSRCTACLWSPWPERDNRRNSNRIRTGSWWNAVFHMSLLPFQETFSQHKHPLFMLPYKCATHQQHDFWCYPVLRNPAFSHFLTAHIWCSKYHNATLLTFKNNPMRGWKNVLLQDDRLLLGREGSCSCNWSNSLKLQGTERCYGLFWSS